MFRTALFVLLIFCLTSSISAAQATDSPETTYRAVSDSGNLYELAFKSGTAEVMKPLPVKISVSNKAGAPISGAKITCSLTMPAMAMPNNKPPIKESAESGQYEGIFLLTMGGLWHVEISAAYKLGGKDSVVIPINGVAAEAADANKVDSKLEELFQKQGSTDQK